MKHLPFHTLTQEVSGMKRRIVAFLVIVSLFVLPVRAEPIRWVSFDVPYESLKYAMEQEAEAIRATRLPIFPIPTIPHVFPESS